MDALQTQVSALSHKVDTLYQMIDTLSYKVSEALSDKHSILIESGDQFSASAASIRKNVYHNRTSLGSAMQHKDILLDSNEFDTNTHQSSQKELSPEVQIQRLTAQLTAAYNRIASLEEQLLAGRFH